MMMTNKQIATFGGGCFWCVEAVIQRLNGVESVVSGYAGGTTPDPSYKSISSGTTGHAEVVQVTFDADVISYEDLLLIFMVSHDPTTLNRQGADRGTHYRSIILHHDAAQEASARKVIDGLNPQFERPIVTELAPLEHFHVAEGYHQNYYNGNSRAGYCRVVIAPKIQKLRMHFADQLKAERA